MGLHCWARVDQHQCCSGLQAATTWARGWEKEPLLPFTILHVAKTFLPPPLSTLTHKGAFAVNSTSSSFSRARRPIYLANVFCTGRESGIQSCSFFTYSLTTGIDLMSELEVAAVTCQRPISVQMLEQQGFMQLQSNIVTAVFVALIFALVVVVSVWWEWCINNVCNSYLK